MMTEPVFEQPPCTFHIADGLSFPAEAVTKTFAILAMRGAGKTYTASNMAEEFLKARSQIVVLDPLGVWWGLRLAADGAHPGLPIVVVGGRHGDVPLLAAAGGVIADFVLTTGQSVILDLSLLRKREQLCLVRDFTVRLFEGNQHPLHLFVDEADLFAPQQPRFKEANETLDALDDIFRRGRSKGLGGTLITQRSAEIDKGVLNQAETLIALRATAPNDRKTIDAWIKDNGTEEERQQVLGSLATLPTGAGWVWSPAWLRLLKLVHFRQRETFDSSATPTDMERREMPVLAPVDVRALGEQLERMLAEAQESDPTVLRARIRQLEEEVRRLRARHISSSANAPLAPAERQTVRAGVQQEAHQTTLNQGKPKSSQASIVGFPGPLPVQAAQSHAMRAQIAPKEIRFPAPDFAELEFDPLDASNGNGETLALLPVEEKRLRRLIARLHDLPPYQRTLLQLLCEQEPTSMDATTIAAWLGLEVKTVQNQPPDTLRTLKVIERERGPRGAFLYRATLRGYVAAHFPRHQPDRIIPMIMEQMMEPKRPVARIRQRKRQNTYGRRPGRK